MAMGQGALVGEAEMTAVDAAVLVLTCSEQARGAQHAAQLRGALVLQEALSAAGMQVATVSQLALALDSSEHHAGRLMSDAEALADLPGALEAVECGLLTVEQSSTVVTKLAVLDLPGRLAVWQRLQQRLLGVADRTALPPARLGELLDRWVLAHDRDAAEQRRREAEQHRDVDYRKRADGLYDLFGLGLNAPDAHAVLSRIAARSRPWGVDDERTAGQRRLEAFRDLLLGRDQLPLSLFDDPVVGDGLCCEAAESPAPSAARCPRCAPRAAGAAPCGCLPGQPVPCGADIAVLMPIGAGLGTTDELADLAGHGPLEPDLLRELLLSGPVLRPVWVDQDSLPVALSDKTIRVERGNPVAVREALLALQAQPPPPPQPRHRLDHPPNAPGADDPGAHPADTPGPYRPPRWLRRLINIRAPRCEWPGCGARAVRCDAEHDQAWPYGPTCACNLGPCCRRHHRVKQTGFIKTRGAGSAVTWTSPTGRSRTSPSQHEPP